MSYITLDMETFFRTRKDKGTPGDRYSLSNLTYEQYIRHPEFKVMGVAVKIDAQPTQWISGRDTEPFLRDLFHENNEHVLICHNALFDIAVLSWYYGLRAKTYYCTQAMSRAIWQTESASLEALALRCFPNDKTKRKGKELAALDGIADPSPAQLNALGEYAINDVELTFECFRFMWPFFPEIEFELLDMTLQMHAHPAFVLDQERVTQFLHTLRSEKQQLIEASGVSRTVLASNDQFAAWLLKHHGIEVPKKHSPTPKNPNNYTWALAKDDLEFHALQRENPELEAVWKARIAVKSTTDESRAEALLDAAQQVYHKPAGVISMPLNYAAAHTLRWGGTQKRNAQNMRRGGELRKSIMAPDGHVIVVADLSNIESRMLAWVADCETILAAYRNKEDLYSQFAERIYNRPIDRKYKLQDADGNYLDANGNITDRDNAHCPDELEGFVGKVCVLGLGYGMGPQKFQDTLAKGALGGPPVYFDSETCHQIVYQIYRKTYPEIPRLWRYCDQVIIPSMANPHITPFDWKCFRVEPQRLRLPNGLYLNYPDLKPIDHPDGGYEYWNGSYYKSLYGGLLTENLTQAIARCVLGEQMLKINRDIREYGARIILTVHDEVLAIAPEQHADTVLNIMISHMKQPPAWCADGSLALDAEGGYAKEYSK